MIVTAARELWQRVEQAAMAVAMAEKELNGGGFAHEWVAACKRIAAEFGGTGAVQRLAAWATEGTGGRRIRRGRAKKEECDEG